MATAIVLPQAGCMDTTNIPTGAIVVGVDGSQSSAAAVQWAATEAGMTKRVLALLHAFQLPTAHETLWLTSGGIAPETVIRGAREDASRLLSQASHAVAAVHPDLEVTILCREEDPRVALLDAAAQAHLTVVGSRGRGPLKSLLLGSVSLAVSRYATQPVVVVRPPAPDAPRRGVLVGTSTDEESQSTLECAYQEASLRDTPLTVLHCDWDGDPSIRPWSFLKLGTPEHTDASLAVAETLAGLHEKYPDVVTGTVLARGVADRCLVDLAAHHELVVVGRHGASALDFTGLGSVAAAVVEHARTTVMVVP